MALTLVPASATLGYRFHFVGANPGDECDGCPFQKLCFGLEPGRTYEVTSMRDVVHPCNLHDEGKVRVVEVEEASFVTSLETKHLRGTAATWNPVPCEYPDCDRYALCHPRGPPAGARYQIVEDMGKEPCPMNYAIHRVRLQRM